jgi:hypothetical protein
MAVRCTMTWTDLYMAGLPRYCAIYSNSLYFEVVSSPAHTRLFAHNIHMYGVPIVLRMRAECKGLGKCSWSYVPLVAPTDVILTRCGFAPTMYTRQGGGKNLCSVFGKNDLA